MISSVAALTAMIFRLLSLRRHVCEPLFSYSVECAPGGGQRALDAAGVLRQASLGELPSNGTVGKLAVVYVDVEVLRVLSDVSNQISIRVDTAP